MNPADYALTPKMNRNTAANEGGSKPERLTERIVRQLQPPRTGNRIVCDSEVPGFGARITATGVVSFTLEYRIHGRHRRMTIGRAAEFSVLRAREKAIELRQRIRDGHDPLAERERLRLENPTMQDLQRRYLEDYASQHKKPKSQYEDRRLFRALILPKLGRQPVSAVTRMDIENLHRSLAATAKQANRVLALLSKAFNLAMEWGWRSDNPAQKVKKYREEPRPDRWLNREEIRRLLRVLRAYPDQQSTNALRVLLYTGARKGETLAAKWQDLDLTAGRWTKLSHTTKEKRLEIIPLSRIALWTLRRMRRESNGAGWVFPGRKPGTHQEDLKGAWEEIRKLASLEGVRIHDLRHSFASHLVSSGESLAIVGKLLGHSSPLTTQRYAHLSDAALRQAANRFGRRNTP